MEEAVAEITAKGLTPVIYTDRNSWKTIASNCNMGTCPTLISLPLWDVEHTTFIGPDGLKHCGDGVPSLAVSRDSAGHVVAFQPYPKTNGWQTRSGNQYDFGLASSGTDDSDLGASSMAEGDEAMGVTPACGGNNLYGITVDLDVFDPNLFQ